MKQVVFLLSFFLLATGIFAQEESKADSLVTEGITLHDKRDYDGAIAKYDAAIQLDPAHHLAIYEKSLSLMSLKKYEEAGELLRQVIKESKDKKIRLSAFVNYVTALDLLDLPGESVKIYDQGIKEFPEYYLLPFNKGVTLLGLKKTEEAADCFKKSVRLNPNHGSSHNVLGRMTISNNRIAGLMALFTFLLVEPGTQRAKDNRELLEQQLMKGVSQKDDKTIEISVDASSLKKDKSKEDDFGPANLALSMTAALSRSKQDSVKKNDAEVLLDRMGTIIAIIDETKNSKKGFFTTFYVPMLVALKGTDHFKTSCYIALATAGNEEVNAWLKANEDKVAAFFSWFKAYKWQ
ncbi:MAG TPA: tetratricopeptide repeat protein [Chitinophagaceae bacterium]|nr:tetratricopeptide repeat protein [Chitinophagaceae bacterium]